MHFTAIIIYLLRFISQIYIKRVRGKYPDAQNSQLFIGLHYINNSIYVWINERLARRHDLLT